MKHQKGKIKTEHHILKDFSEFLREIEELELVKRIIPWRISRQQKWTNQLLISFSYFTNSWLKFNLKKWATVQEVFIICDLDKKQQLLTQIQEIINNYIN